MVDQEEARCNVSFTGDCSGDITMFKRPVDNNTYGYCEYHVNIGVPFDRRSMPDEYRLIEI